MRLLCPTLRWRANCLKGLGLVPTLSFEKKRQHWQLDECTIVLDTLPYLGDFIEIEGPSERSVREVRERVGLGDQPMIGPSYIALLMDYRKQHAIEDTFIQPLVTNGTPAMPAPVTLDTAKRYRIPPTRLPFVNTEIAQVKFGGEDHLVSSIYGGASGGRLYFWHPEKRTHAMRQMPEGVSGAYMLKRGH